MRIILGCWPRVWCSHAGARLLARAHAGTRQPLRRHGTRAVFRSRFAKRVARQLARGTGRSYRRSGVCPCVPVWVSIIWCPVRTRKHTRPRRCIPRVGACIPPSLCTPRPPSAELRAETQIGLRLLGSYIDRGGRCHQSSFVAMFRLYRVSAFAMSMRFD